MPEKILVVDDDIDSLKLIGLMLQRNGYEVIAASAGNQALTKAASRPHVIIRFVFPNDNYTFREHREESNRFRFPKESVGLSDKNS